MNILITGSKRGIGYATALELAKRNHLVYASTHYKKDALRLNKKHKDNPNLIFFKLDITKKEDREKVKNLDIDVLINNAALGESGSICEIPINRVRKNYETNIFSCFELTQLILKDMIKKDKGKIIFIGSLAGVMPRIWVGVYSSTKSALKSLVKTLKKELKQINSSVKISLIEPGSYKTGFNQDIMNTKYEWLKEDSPFYSIKNKIKQKETTYFNIVEHKKLNSIVKKIVKAATENNHKFAYRSPLEQVIYVWLYKVFSK